MKKSFVLMMTMTLISFGVVYAAPGGDGKPTEITVEGAEVFPNPAKADEPAEKPAQDPVKETGSMPHVTKHFELDEHPGKVTSSKDPGPQGSAKPDTLDDLLADKPAEKPAGPAKPAGEKVKVESQKPIKTVHPGKLDSILVKPGDQARQRAKERKAQQEPEVTKHDGELTSDLIDETGKKKATEKHPGKLDSSKKPGDTSKLRKVTHGGRVTSERIGGPGEKTRQQKAKADKPVDGVPVTGKEKAKPPTRRDRSWKGPRSRTSGQRPGVVHIRHADGRVWIIRRSERRPGRARRKRLPVQK